MPKLDGMGPNGMGPVTGWGRGRCGGYGMGRNYGGARIFRGSYRFADDCPYRPSKEEYIDLLQNEIKEIEAEIENLKK